MRKTMSVLLVFAVIASVGGTVKAAGPHPIATPFGDDAEIGEPSIPVEREAARIPTDHLDLGTEHILDQQCQNGGFGWPHADCSATYHNITAPILLGVLGTYYLTFDGVQLVGALNGGAFDLVYTYANGEARFGSFTALYMLRLGNVAGNTTFLDHVEVNLFDELAAGTYGPDDFDTAGWIANIQTGRSGAWVNLRPWEFQALISVSKALGQPGQDDLFEAAILDGLDTLDNSDSSAVFSDILGVAGAVKGLADARILSFPPIVAPLHGGVNGIDNLQDLAAYLASLQNPSGSWYWHSNLSAPTTGDEDVQTTAYATLALLAVDKLTAASYQPATESARDWMLSLQLPDGGFPQWPGGDENTEVEGEALTAIAAFDATIFVDGFEAGNSNLWGAVVP
jgi:hypothetical protein